MIIDLYNKCSYANIIHDAWYYVVQLNIRNCHSFRAVTSLSYNQFIVLVYILFTEEGGKVAKSCRKVLSESFSELMSLLYVMCTYSIVFCLHWMLQTCQMMTLVWIQTCNSTTTAICKLQDGVVQVTIPIPSYSGIFKACLECTNPIQSYTTYFSKTCLHSVFCI